MAKQASFIHKTTKKVKRPNVHSKTKTTALKSSKNYRKLYRGQGR